MGRYLLIFVAYIIIYIGAGYKRENDFEIFSKDWWVQVLLITVGGTILLNIPID